MRHGKKFNHLGRTSPHRKAMLSNMASSLILHKRITTTLAKARELRKYVEPMITKSKENTTHNRRVVFSYLGNKESVSELFGDVASKVANRPGGYTRIFKIGNRLGDNADMAIIELVDYNELMLAAKTDKKGGAVKTRRSRRGSGATATAAAPATPKAKAEKPAAPVAPIVEDAVVVEEEVKVADEVVDTTADVVETTEDVVETPTASAEENNDEAAAEEEEKKD